MIPAAALAIAMAAAIPGATGDAPTGLGYALEVSPQGAAHLYQPYARQATPRPPRRVTGWSAWTCSATRVRVVCTASRTSVRASAVARYTATRRVSSVVVDATSRGGGR